MVCCVGVFVITVMTFRQGISRSIIDACECRENGATGRDAVRVRELVGAVVERSCSETYCENVEVLEFYWPPFGEGLCEHCGYDWSITAGMV